MASAFSQDFEKGWADITLKNLSLREKIAQLVQIRVPGKFINRRSPEFQAIRDLVKRDRVGGVVLFAGNVYESAVLLNELQTASKLPLLVSADFERGAAFRIADTTSFPWTMALGATGSEQYAFQQGTVTAREARAMGVHWIFAPVMDVNNNPENPVINIRSYGEDPQLVARLGSAFIRGAKKAGVLTTAKHFPGHGDTSTDSHVGLAVVQSDLSRLQSIEFAPFRSAIEAGVDSIMTAHVAVPQVTGDAEAPATVSAKILTGLLRDTLKFDGLLVTDALEMGGITNSFWCGLAAIRSIQAGADVLLLPPNAVVAINEVERAVKRGDIPESRINESARKILHAKSRMGLHHRRTVSIDRIGEIVSSPESMKLAQDIADHSITVVKDEKRLLPLNPAGDLKLFSLVLAPGLESSPGSIFQAEMRRRFPSIRTTWGNSRITDEMLADIERDISRSDLIVCSTLVRLISGEDTHAIPENHRAIFQKILASRKSLIWVAFGNPYVLRYAPQVGTYLCAFSYSDVSQIAAAKALAGEIAIRGTMPVSIPGHSSAGDGMQIPKLEMTLKFESPESSGLRANAFDQIIQLLDSFVGAGVFPGARILAGYKGAVALDLAAGKTGFSTHSVDVSPDTVYSLDSLSTIVLSSAAMLEAESGGLILKDRIQNYVPEYKGRNAEKLRVQDLLTALSKSSMAETEEMDARRDLLEEIISRASGLPFRRLLADRLFGPLGMRNSFYDAPPKNFRGSIARAGEGATGGLFCSAHDLAIFAQMLLNRGVYDHRRIFSPAAVARFTGPGGSWSKPSNSDWTAQVFSSSALGHNSPSGASLWIDPAKELFIVFLTNAVQSSNDKDRVSKVQQVINESVIMKITNEE